MVKESTKTGRRRFLKQVVVTLATAVGAGAFAKAAFAIPGQCCRNCDTCGFCGGNNCWCYCDCSGTGSPSYCFTGVGSACMSPTSSCILCPC